MSIDVQAPDGSSVSFPDGTGADVITSAMQAHFGKPAGAAAPAPVVPVAEAPSVAGDVAKSGGIGLAKGVIGLAGLPGDLSELGARGIDRATQFVGDKLGVDVKPRPDQPFRGGSADIQKGVESVTGEFYKPKTTAGEFAQTAGEFAPGLIGGPETLLTKLATRVAAPAIASEAAGQVTKGTAAEPVARVAGAVLGGMGGARALRPAAAEVPTAAELKTAAQAGYQHPEVAAVQIKPQAVTSLADTIKADLESGHNSGFRALNQPKTFSAIEELKNPNQTGAIAAGAPVTVADIDSVRKVLTRLSIDPAEKAAAARAMGHVEDFLSTLKQPDLLAGDAAKASGIMTEARGNYAASMRSETVAKQLARAQLNADSAGAGANIDNATRQSIKSILINPKKLMGYSPDEIAQMQKIVGGTYANYAARLLGKLAPTGVVSSGLSAGAGFLAGGPVGALGLPALGAVAKKIADTSTLRQAEKLQNMIRSRSPLAKQIVAATPVSQLSNPVQRGAISAALAQPFGSLAPMLRP